MERRDLLVDQDVRERKGAFFTPQKWVELSQEYLAMELGENWQDEYVIWDCCAGTGNLEAGLTNKYNIWVSTIDRADVAVMHTRIKMMNEKSDGAANLLDEHVFQFDFLNDSFDKLPKGLKTIVDDPEKRKKLVVYINPPYAEASNAKTVTGTGSQKTSVAKSTAAYSWYQHEIGTAARELFAQFIYRVNKELSGCVLGQFSTLKHLQAQNFSKFRNLYRADLRRGFVVPANTFDNVKGDFPIGFFIWRVDGNDLFRNCVLDVYDSTSQYMGQKTSFAHDGEYIIDWLRQFYDKKNPHIGYLQMVGTDVQHTKNVFISTHLSDNDILKHTFTYITRSNVAPMCIYYAVRHVIVATWLNDRDQFLSPSFKVLADADFVGDCVCFVLFNNSVKSSDGTNHWIPFTEEEVDAKDNFESHFMSDFLKGKVDVDAASSPRQMELATSITSGQESASPLLFAISPEARAVLEAGCELWRYYHKQPKANPNASYYDIRKHFQGVKITAKGKEQMNATSDDLRYNELLAGLKQAMKKLAAKIEPKVYEYGFLKK